MKRQLPQSLALMLVLLSGSAALAAQGTGFLDPYPEMTQHPEYPEVQIWRDKGFDLAKYDKFVIEPITVFVSPDSEYKGVTADEISALSDGFRAALIGALEPAYPVVDVPDDRTIVARIAVTNVSFEKEKRGLLGYTPIGAVVTAAKDAAGARIKLKQAGIETELLDGKTGKRLQATVDGNPFQGSGKKEKSWSDIENRLKVYAERFRKRMDQARKPH
jgi:hypothetical protein